MTRAPAARLVAAAAGGALYAAGYVGDDAWPLLAAFLVPLWLALDARGPGASAGGAAALGFAFGLVAHSLGFTWLMRLVDVFLAQQRALGAVLWLAHGAFFATGFAAYALLYDRLRARGAGRVLAGAAPLVAVEWLWPQVFPVHAGAALVGAPVLAQTADLGGPLLLTALVASANAVVAALVDATRARRAPRARGALAAAAIAAVVLAYGVARERAFGAHAGAAGEPVLRVGVVQADLGLLEKRDAGLAGQRAHVAMTRELLADGPLDLVVWPETAIARALRRPLPLDGQLVRGDLDVALLFGGTSVFEEGGRRARANSAFLVGADGAIRDAYDKNLLIPIAEWLPFEEAWPALRASLPHAQRFRASRETPALRLGDARIATPICYEAIRPAFVRAMVRASRANLLVTLANDAWFGDSREPHLHLALARLRAIEHRRWLVRATNSGVSAIVDPAGRVRTETGVLERATLRGRVGLRDDTTLYARAGDWTGAAAVAAVAAALLVATGGPKPTA